MVPTVKNPSNSAAIIPRDINCCRSVFRTLLSTLSGVTEFVAELAVERRVLGDLMVLRRG
jgi:hypothetical protein